METFAIDEGDGKACFVEDRPLPPFNPDRVLVPGDPVFLTDCRLEDVKFGVITNQSCEHLDSFWVKFDGPMLVIPRTSLSYFGEEVPEAHKKKWMAENNEDGLQSD